MNTISPQMLDLISGNVALLKTAGDGLQFSLRDQSFAGQQNRGGPANAAPVVTPDDSLPTLDIAASGYTRYTGRIGGVDIRV